MMPEHYRAMKRRQGFMFFSWSMLSGMIGSISMDRLPKPDIILTHESDLDGLVSGCLLKRLAQHMFQVDVPLAAYHLPQWQNRQMTERAAWVCDLTLDARVDRQGWVVVDHHPSAHQPKRATYVFSQEKSASRLCYDLLEKEGIGNPELERLVHLTNVADLFLESDPDFEMACDYAELVKAYHFHPLVKLLEGRVESILNHPLLEVMQVKRSVEDPIGLDWARRHLEPLAPGVSSVDLAIGNHNVIMNQLLKDSSLEDQVLLSVSRRAPYQYGVSLRSRNGKARDVAVQLHGGGHPNAAGATLPKSVKSVSTGLDYIRQVLSPKQELKPDGGLSDLASALDALQD
jgi:hypothetical protein